MTRKRKHGSGANGQSVVAGTNLAPSTVGTQAAILNKGKAPANAKATASEIDDIFASKKGKSVETASTASTSAATINPAEKAKTKRKRQGKPSTPTETDKIGEDTSSSRAIQTGGKESSGSSQKTAKTATVTSSKAPVTVVDTSTLPGLALDDGTKSAKKRRRQPTSTTNGKGATGSADSGKISKEQAAKAAEEDEAFKDSRGTFNRESYCLPDQSSIWTIEGTLSDSHTMLFTPSPSPGSAL